MLEFISGAHAALEDLAEANFPGMAHAFVHGAKGPALEKVWRVESVPGSPQILGERENPRGLP